MKSLIIRRIIPILAIAVTMACTDNKPDASQSDSENNPVVSTIEAKSVLYSDQIRATGRLTFSNEYKLSFKTSGIVESVSVKEGQYVTKNTSLASLKLDEIESVVEQAEIAYEKAKRDFGRAEALYADSVATLEQLQNAQSQLNNASMNLQTARFNLNYSRIAAPQNGVVQKVLVNENEITGAGNPVIIFGAENSGKVLIVSVSDADVVKLDLGDKAILHFDPFPETRFVGEVVEIAGMANPMTGTYEVNVQVNDAQNQLLPGFIGSTYIQSSHEQTLIEIPVNALVLANEKQGKVYVVTQGKAIERIVKIERLYENKVLISEGLVAGENVILDGHHRIAGNNVMVTVL